jgi:hypothetical protein
MTSIMMMSTGTGRTLIDSFETFDRRDHAKRVGGGQNNDKN